MSIQLRNIYKHIGNETILNNINLDISEGEFFSLLGESGCGKTTLLRIIAGFDKDFEGNIIIDGIDITHIPPYYRPVNMMFQSYALFPHYDVWDNIAFGLKQDKLPEAIINTRVEQMLQMTNLERVMNHMPHQLSGGQKQRVALARALIKHPKVLLLDEPLSALDEKLREKTQFDLVNLQEKIGITFIVVTHNQEEAMTMSSKVAVMSKGEILQIGSPSEIYEYPNCIEVAKFIGSMNIIDGIVKEIHNTHVIVIGDHNIRYKLPYSNVPLDGQVQVLIRPEKMYIKKEDPKQEYNCMNGTIDDIAYLGDISIYYVNTRIGIVIVTKPNIFKLVERELSWNDNVYIYWNMNNANIIY